MTTLQLYFAKASTFSQRTRVLWIDYANTQIERFTKILGEPTAVDASQK